MGCLCCMKPGYLAVPTLNCCNNNIYFLAHIWFTCYRSKFCNHQRGGSTKLLKSLYPFVHTAKIWVKLFRNFVVSYAQWHMSSSSYFNSPSVGRYLTLYSRCVASMRLLKGKRVGVKTSVRGMSVWGPSASFYASMIFSSRTVAEFIDPVRELKPALKWS